MSDPLSTVSYALQDWQDEFEEEWKDAVIDPSAPWPDQEEARKRNEVNAFFRPYNKRLGALYSTILTQQYSPALPEQQGEDPYRDTLEVPSHIDLRRLSFLPKEATWLFEYLDSLLLCDVVSSLERQHSTTEKRRALYVPLLVTAVEGRVSPIASWYLQRATLLLLLGMHVECAVMCRAVLEAALRFRLDESDLVRVGTRKSAFKNGEAEYSLADLCWAAERVIPGFRDAAGDARKIRRDGNDLLHPPSADRLEAVTDLQAMPYIAALSHVLQLLFPKEQ